MLNLPGSGSGSAVRKATRGGEVRVKVQGNRGEPEPLGFGFGGEKGSRVWGEVQIQDRGNRVV